MTKKIFLCFIASFLLCICTISNAATPNIIPDLLNDLSVKLTINGLTFDSSKTYKVAVMKDSSSIPTDTDWNDLTSSNNTYIYTISSTNSILKTNSNVYIWLKEDNSTSYILQTSPVDLPLPTWGKRFNIETSGTSSIKIKPIYSIASGQYQFEKITDTQLTDLLEDFYSETNATAKANLLTEILELLPDESTLPASGSSWKSFNSSTAVPLPTLSSGEEEAYYYIYLKTTESNARTIADITTVQVKSSKDSNPYNNVTTNNTATTNTVTNTNSDLPETGDSSFIILIAIIFLCATGFVSYKKSR